MKARLRAMPVVLALAAGLATASTMALAAPAEAATSGPTVRDMTFRWIPGTGSVHVLATVKCSPQVYRAGVTFELGQSGVGAKASRHVRCDGRAHHLTLILDPKKGRFHPGHADLSWSTRGCSGDLCWVGVADGFTTIKRPGQAGGPRGAR
jgi:hypothetical protein